MLDNSFHFYKNGMSTGAASMISLNSDEYAPSSRAVSPAESINERLSEVEQLPPRREINRYAMLDEKQKADLLSHLLLQGTLESMDSDLQGWVTNYVDSDNTEQEPFPTSVAPARPKLKHKGGLKSGSFTSMPRLPPIYSAGARPTTPVESQSEDMDPFEVPGDGKDGNLHAEQTPSEVDLDVLDPSAVELYLANDNLQMGGGKGDVYIYSYPFSVMCNFVWRRDGMNKRGPPTI